MDTLDNEKRVTNGIQDFKNYHTYSFSFPPVTMSPSLSVVYIVKIGPACAWLTTLARLEPAQTKTSPLIDPVNVVSFYEDIKVSD